MKGSGVWAAVRTTRAVRCGAPPVTNRLADVHAVIQTTVYSISLTSARSCLGTNSFYHYIKTSSTPTQQQQLHAPTLHT